MRQPPLPRFRSPLRGPWLTATFARVLLVGLPVVIVTGLLSYAAYEPRLAGNDTTPGAGLLRFYLFAWPTSPSWIYRLTQGVHVTLALVLIPVVLAKLWSVIPRLFVFPPVTSVAQAVERISLLALVGGILFEVITGVLNIQNDYVFGFSFYTAHLYGAWVFIAGFVVHVGIKLPTMRRALRTRRLREELHVPLEATGPERTGLGIDDELVTRTPAPATMSRRGLLAVVTGAAALVGGLSVGQTLGGPLRRTALLSPRGRSYGSGPTDFQVNITAAAAGVAPAATGGAWRLAVTGPGGSKTLSRAELLAMDQHSYQLPIACVEGWSSVQTWTGVRLRDLAALVGARGHQVHVQSIQSFGFGSVRLSEGQVADHATLLALKVNGADLTRDHGYPARMIIPGAPGVHCTKWVRQLSFEQPA